MASSRVVYNRRTENQLLVGIADGFLELGERVVKAAHPPDAPPYGKGLVKRGGAIAFVGRSKVGGKASKPRRSEPFPNGVTVYFGYGFPARFQELGTVNQPARPFLIPAMDAVLPGAAHVLRPKVMARLSGL